MDVLHQVHRWSRQPYIRGGYSGPCVGSSQSARRSAQLPLSERALLSAAAEEKHGKHEVDVAADPKTPAEHSYIEVLSKLREDLLTQATAADMDPAADEEAEHKSHPRDSASLDQDDQRLYVGAGKGGVLFFSGEALSETGFGSVHAALESAELAVQQILQSFDP